MSKPVENISESAIVEVPAAIVDDAAQDSKNVEPYADGLPKFYDAPNIVFPGSNDTVAVNDANRRNTFQLGQRFRSASFGALDLLREKKTEVSSDPRDHWRAIIGEFLGTTVFIYFVLALNVNSLALRKSPSDTSLLEGAFTAGGALTALIFTLGHVSGGHLNPAVTACIVLVRALPVAVGFFYWVAQFVGSIAAAGLFLATNPSDTVITAENVGLSPKINSGSAFLVQLVVSGFLCWVVLATGVDSHGAEPRNFLAPLPIGIAVSVGVIMSGPLIGASMNPAGAFGMILLKSFWESAWIYIPGPIIASLIVGIVYKLVFMSRNPDLMKKISDRLHGSK